jgi:hypothetical protein
MTGVLILPRNEMDRVRENNGSGPNVFGLPVALSVQIPRPSVTGRIGMTMGTTSRGSRSLY